MLLGSYIVNLKRGKFYIRTTRSHTFKFYSLYFNLGFLLNVAKVKALSILNKYHLKNYIL